MLKWIFSGLVVLAVVFGALTGRMDAVTTAALRECGSAVELTFALMGSIVLWSGLMEVVNRTGLTGKLSRLFSPVITRLFEGMEHNSRAAKAITLNLSANLLGLGNAATPLGIAAMKELEREQPGNTTASNNMVMFVVLNTSSLQLLPTTTALLRANAGSAAPMDIMPAVWCASVCSIACGIFAAKLLGKWGWGGAWPTNKQPRSPQRSRAAALPEGARKKGTVGKG